MPDSSQGPRVPPPSALDLIRADPRLRTRDDTGVAAIAVGTAAWALALAVMLIWGPAMTGIDVSEWTLVCLCGALLGIPGLAIVLARRSRRRRARQE